MNQLLFRMPPAEFRQSRCQLTHSKAQWMVHFENMPSNVRGGRHHAGRVITVKSWFEKKKKHGTQAHCKTTRVERQSTLQPTNSAKQPIQGFKFSQTVHLADQAAMSVIKIIKDHSEAKWTCIPIRMRIVFHTMREMRDRVQFWSAKHRLHTEV